MAQMGTAVHFGLFFTKINRINLGAAGLAPACQETAADSASACPAPSARMAAEGTKPKWGQRIKTLNSYRLSKAASILRLLIIHTPTGKLGT